MKKIVFMIIMLIMVVSITGCLECKHKSTTPATCTDGEKCNICGEILSEPAEHKWEDATCTTPKTCSSCNKTEGTAKGHNWRAASCTSPKTCIKCNKTEGTAKGHNWKAATCKAPKTCTWCNIKEGNIGSHSYKNGYCSYCSGKDPNYLDIMDNDVFVIKKINWDINSASGVEVDIQFKNMSSKQIAYVYFTIKFYDRMGSAAYCEIKNSHTQRLRYIGPINAGVTKTGYWDPVIYNSATAVIKPLKIEIEYTDGTKRTFTCNGAYWYSNSFYGGTLKD